MREFINHLTERNYSNRTVAFVENGSWAPMAAKVMKGMLEKSKNLTFAENTVRIMSALDADSKVQLVALAAELCRKPEITEQEEVPAAPAKKYVCKVCGYVYEGDSLPEDFVCPLCKCKARVFKEVE